MEFIYDNLLDLYKAKTFIWIQYLIENNKIKEDELFKNDKIFFDCDIALEKINKSIFEKDVKNLFIKIILNYKKYFFVFNTIFVNKSSNIHTNINLPNEFKNKENYFVYPEILYFIEKESESLNIVSQKKIFINIKCLFNQNLKIHKIELLREKDYYFIKECSSNTNQLDKNNISNDDITIFLFHHPELCERKNIYGFIYYYSNVLHLISTDYRFCINPF